MAEESDSSNVLEAKPSGEEAAVPCKQPEPGAPQDQSISTPPPLTEPAPMDPEQPDPGVGPEGILTRPKIEYVRL